MRISKLLSAVCAAAFLAGFFAVRAQDNPAQAAARAALMEKISELNAQPSPPANQRMAPAIIVTPTGTSVVQSSAPATDPPPVETQPPASASPATLLAPADTPDNPAQAAARAALMEKISQLNAQPSPTANQAPVAATANSSPFSPVPPPSNPKVQISPRPPCSQQRPR